MLFLKGYYLKIIIKQSLFILRCLQPVLVHIHLLWELILLNEVKTFKVKLDLFLKNYKLQVSFFYFEANCCYSSRSKCLLGTSPIINKYNMAA